MQFREIQHLVMEYAHLLDSMDCAKERSDYQGYESIRKRTHQIEVQMGNSSVNLVAQMDRIIAHDLSTGEMFTSMRARRGPPPDPIGHLRFGHPRMVGNDVQLMDLDFLGPQTKSAVPTPNNRNKLLLAYRRKKNAA